MTSATAPEAFPQLTAAQLQRLEPHGHRRKLAPGEVVGEPGQPVTKIFVVVSGRLDAFTQNTVQASKDLAISFTPGMFTGERSVLAGGRFLGRISAVTPSDVLEIERDELLKLMATDTELSDIFLRAFILRRLQLIDREQGDVVILGSNHCSGLLHIFEFLTRNGHPYKMVDLDSDAASQELLDQFHLTLADIPVVICRGSLVLKNPTVEKLADCLGLNPTLDRTQIWDLVIIGAGPAGLGAAVYAASEGLNVVVVEANAPGGQAGTSSKIENYFGFPTGISGQALAGRGLSQCRKFGAEVGVPIEALGIECDKGQPFHIRLSHDEHVYGRAVVIATGARYRKPELARLEHFQGRGVYYSATYMEAAFCGNEELVIVGGGNSAGQAAVFLSGFARHVHIVIRGEGLAASMSNYLIRRIEAAPNITVHVRTQIVALNGEAHLESIQWNQQGRIEEKPIRHVFLFLGAQPNTGWLGDCVELDRNGFVLTGPDVAHKWTSERTGHFLETSRPGIFAVGDVRSGSVKRVAAAVGEGAAAIQSLHQYLALGV